MGYGAEEESIRQLHYDSGAIEEFHKLKPELKEKQQRLYNAFLNIGSQRRYEQGTPFAIRERDMDYHINKYGCCDYPKDLFELAIKSIDNNYIQKKHAEIQRRIDKG